MEEFLIEALIVCLIRAVLAIPARPVIGPAQHLAGLAQGRRAAAAPRAGRQGRAGAYGDDGETA